MKNIHKPNSDTDSSSEVWPVPVMVTIPTVNPSSNTPLQDTEDRRDRKPK